MRLYFKILLVVFSFVFAFIAGGFDVVAQNAVDVEYASDIISESRSTSGIPEQITLPLIGTIQTQNFSLPFLTVVFGTLDGFNPCAMWALIFLISLLLKMEDRKRMWILGSAFIVTSGIVYFLFMAAWLNILLFLGFIIWIRVAIGGIAIAGGVYSLREFFSQRGATCDIEGSESKTKIFDRLQRFSQNKKFWLALGGIILLAAAVNLIELFCSAGLPAIYTQILVLNNLSVAQYYGYLGLYIFFFMLDDLLVFFVAMTTLRLTGLSTKYSNISRLIGGLLMVIIGLLLLLKPEWLMFG